MRVSRALHIGVHGVTGMLLAGAGVALLLVTDLPLGWDSAARILLAAA